LKQFGGQNPLCDLAAELVFQVHTMTHNRSHKVLHKDILFDNLLEAQWASFFDTISVRYQYRPTRFNLSPGVSPGLAQWYEPQFFLVDDRKWFEAFPRLGAADLWRISCALVFGRHIRSCTPPWPSASDCYLLALGPVGADSVKDPQSGIFSVDQGNAILADLPEYVAIDCRAVCADCLCRDILTAFRSCFGRRSRTAGRAFRVRTWPSSSPATTRRPSTVQSTLAGKWIFILIVAGIPILGMFFQRPPAARPAVHTGAIVFSNEAALTDLSKGVPIDRLLALRLSHAEGMFREVHLEGRR
jgi:hypothetical protein